MSNKSPPLMHGIALVASGAIGAGIFSLPIVTAGMWFPWTVLCLFAVWLLCYVGALVLLEATLVFPRGASFNTIVKGILGPGWNIANGIGVGFLMYILLYAYISGGGNIINHALASLAGSESPVPQNISSLAFALFFGFLVWVGTSMVSRLCTLLMMGMALSYLMFNSGLVLHVEMVRLFDLDGQEQHYSRYIWMALPYILSSFGFSGLIPSLVKYYGTEPRTIHACILYGTLVTLLLYLVWILVAFGTLSRQSLAPVIEKGGNIGDLVTAFQAVVETRSQTMSLWLGLFSNFAVTSSMLAVGLCMFDYVADACGFDDDRVGRLKSALVAFGPPALVCLIFPYGFIFAIGFAGVVMIFSYFVVPVRMVLKVRSDQLKTRYRVPGGKPVIYSVLAFCLLIALCEFLSMLGLLPAYP